MVAYPFRGTVRAQHVHDATWIRLHRDAALIQQGGTCRYCLCALTRQEATADHRRARSRGGNNRRGNIVAACEPCNGAKGTMPETVFLRAIKADPGPSTPLPILRAWMRRRIGKRTEAAVRRIESFGLDLHPSRPPIAALHASLGIVPAHLRPATTARGPTGQGCGDRTAEGMRA